MLRLATSALVACFEESLRHGGVGAVVAEVSRLSVPALRRLQLTAEGTGTLGLALRRWRRPVAAASAWRSKWRPKIRRVVSLYLQSWSTDRARRTLGGGTPPPEVPFALIGRIGRRCQLEDR